MSENSTVACRDFAAARHSRRVLLTAGAVAGGSLSLARLLKAESAGELRASTAKNCIFLFQFGGPSQFESFDPKPEAPLEIRGEFDAIQTSNPALRIGEHLPKLAAMAHRFALA